jgi:hypothetical protein
MLEKSQKMSIRIIKCLQWMSISRLGEDFQGFWMNYSRLEPREDLGMTLLFIVSASPLRKG